MDFTLSVVRTLVASGVATTVTITLTGSGTLASDATFVATGPGTASSIPLLPTGSAAGTTTSFTYALTDSAALIVTGSGGLSAVHALDLTVPHPRTTTANKIISLALGALMVRGPGQTVDGNEASDILPYLNAMLDAWRTRSLFAYATEAFTGTVVEADRSITIGPTGDIVAPFRPIRLEAGSFFTSSGLDYPIATITQAEYSGIGYKVLGNIGPDASYYEPTLPNGTLHLYPQPSGDVTISLRGVVEVNEFVDLTTGYDLAPGYERAIYLSLAQEISPLYEKQMSPSAAKAAALARRDIQRANHVTPALRGSRPRGDILAGWET